MPTLRTLPLLLLLCLFALGCQKSQVEKSQVENPPAENPPVESPQVEKSQAEKSQAESSQVASPQVESESLLVESEESQVENDEPKPESGSSVSVEQIVLGETTSVESPLNWNKFDLEESQCSVVWPGEDEPNVSVKLDDGDLTFVIDSSNRDKDHQVNFTGMSISNLVEIQVRKNGKQLVSESKQEGGLFVRMYAYRDNEYTRLGRIYVANTRYWFISAIAKNGKETDPRVQYFFEGFKVNQ